MTHDALPTVAVRMISSGSIVERLPHAGDALGAGAGADRSSRLVDSSFDAPKASDGVIRGMDRSYLKRPDRGVPPPRSGSPRLAVAIATYKSHELLEQCLASMAEHLPELLTQGRRIPGTDVVIISPEQFIAADPDCVLLTLPDLYEDVRQC